MKHRRQQGMLNTTGLTGILWLLGLSIITVMLSACGQTGPLYLPGKKTPYGQPYYSPLHKKNSNKTTNHEDKDHANQTTSTT